MCVVVCVCRCVNVCVHKGESMKDKDDTPKKNNSSGTTHTHPLTHDACHTDAHKQCNTNTRQPMNLTSMCSRRVSQHFTAYVPQSPDEGVLSLKPGCLWVGGREEWRGEEE